MIAVSNALHRRHADVKLSLWTQDSLAAALAGCHNDTVPERLTLQGAMTESGTFAGLVGLAQAGDEQAAQRLHDEYAHHILRAVRRRLHPTMRPQFDSLDFAQDVWASFFVTAGPDYAVQTPEQLVALLTAMARNKVAEKSRDRMMRPKRNVNRERGLDEGVANNVLVDRTTPSQVAMGEEAWDKLLALQPPVYRRVLMLLRDGKTPAAIASEMKISSKTVQRVLRLVRS